MNVVQRAFAYLLRKKGKTLSLFLLVFAVAVFLVSCFGVLKASERLEGDIRTSLGAAFYIRANTEVSMKENGETDIRENHVRISQKEIDEIMQTGEIRCCNPVNYGFAKSDEIEFIPGDKHNGENNMGKVTALRFSALAPDFTDETAVLAEGRHITAADSGKILVSERLAEDNRLSVGSTLTLTHARFGEKDGAYIDEIPVKTAYARVEICGIYRRDSEEAPARPTAGLAENEIYASLDVLNQLRESEADMYTGEVDFYVTDPAQLESIIRNVRTLQSIDWTTHFIRTNDFRYARVADRLSALGDLARLLLLFVSVVSAALLTLILTMRMRGRVQEAGILLSIGISKRQILAGFWLEVSSVSAAAFFLSYAASVAATGILGHHLFYGLPPGLFHEDTLSAGVKGSILMEEYLKLRVPEVLIIYLCQAAVITASVFVSSGMIMRLKPKEILSKMS